MSHSARCGNGVVPVGDGACGCRAAADKRRPCAKHRAVRALRPARAELSDGSAVCRPYYSVSLGSYQGLVVKTEENEGFYKLRLYCGGANYHNGLAGEDGCSLRYGIDVAREAKITKVG